MNLRLITATRGTSPHFEATLRSARHAAAAATHVVVAPRGRLTQEQHKGFGYILLPEEARGLYPNLNAGARWSPDWDFLSWINDDDLLMTPGFGQLLEAAGQPDPVDVVYGRVALINGAGIPVGELPVARCPTDLLPLLAQGIVPMAQPGTLISRRLWQVMGGLDESYQLAADLDFFVRALLAGARFSFVNAVVASFRLSAGQLSKRRDAMATETARALAAIAPGRASRTSWWRFRCQNAAVYLNRWRRHGFVTMQQLYEKTE